VTLLRFWNDSALRTQDEATSDQALGRDP
jgi:hypothetical protein